MQLVRAPAIVDDVVANASGPVSVFVADVHGELVAAATMDGAAPDTRLNAQRKAYTAARSDATSTRELADKARADPVERASFDPFFTFFLGGIAVFEDGRRVGAVGVSGLPGELDEQLALVAIDSSAPGTTTQGAFMATVSVRYIVNDVDAAIEFYCGRLGFSEEMHPAPSFAMLSRGDLRLVLSAPGGGPGGGQAMPDGTLPEPGGWNRFQLEVTDLARMVEELRTQGARFRSGVITGVGGKQILLEDPSGNPVELFEPTRSEAALSTTS